MVAENVPDAGSQARGRVPPERSHKKIIRARDAIIEPDTAIILIGGSGPCGGNTTIPATVRLLADMASMRIATPK